VVQQHKATQAVQAAEQVTAAVHLAAVLVHLVKETMVDKVEHLVHQVAAVVKARRDRQAAQAAAVMVALV
jgi:hypothetical protein